MHSRGCKAGFNHNNQVYSKPQSMHVTTTVSERQDHSPVTSAGPLEFLPRRLTLNLRNLMPADSCAFLTCCITFRACVGASDAVAATPPRLASDSCDSDTLLLQVSVSLPTCAAGSDGSVDLCVPAVTMRRCDCGGRCDCRGNGGLAAL